MKKAPNTYAMILEAAERLGCQVEAAPDEWAGSAFNAVVLGAASSRRSVQRDERDLPDLVAAARIDGTPLLVGELVGPGDEAVVEEQMRRFRNQAMIARSWLGSEGPNLQLFLAAPPGAFSRPVWRERAAQIESDDRICRKLVWMFDDAPSVDGALDFLGRTFVAQPWPKEETGPKDLQLETGLPPRWRAVVENDELDAEGVVLEIVRLEGEAE